jgi:TonB family protein
MNPPTPSLGSFEASMTDVLGAPIANGMLTLRASGCADCVDMRPANNNGRFVASVPVRAYTAIAAAEGFRPVERAVSEQEIRAGSEVAIRLQRVTAPTSPTDFGRGPTAPPSPPGNLRAVPPPVPSVDVVPDLGSVLSARITTAGWVDAGPSGGGNKITPLVTAVVTNNSTTAIHAVTITVALHRGQDDSVAFRWTPPGFAWSVESASIDSLPPGGARMVTLRSANGYTSPQTADEMLTNSGFVDVRGDIVAFAGRAQAVLGSFAVPRRLVGSPRATTTRGTVQAPVRVGGQIKQPTKIKDVKPEYPAIAQSARVQGVVIIEATVGVDGKIVDAKILRSIPLLDAAALDAVRQWEFTPTVVDGVPVPVIMTVTVNFSLQ